MADSDDIVSRIKDFDLGRPSELWYHVGMQVELKNSELEAFINSQVRAGRFANPHAAVEAAVEQMRITMEPLDDATIAAIARADEQYASGDYVEWRSVRDQMRAQNAVR